MTDESAPVEMLHDGRWLKLLKRGTWEYVARANPAGAVIIVAVTDRDEVVLVEQYRVPIARRTIEMPAGLVGDQAAFSNETAIESARRELVEEAGYEAARFDFVMSGPVSAGLTTEVATFVRATGLKKVGEGGGDESEDIIVHHVPRAECAAWLAAKMREGFAIDPKLYAGLYFIERDVEGRPWNDGAQINPRFHGPVIATEKPGA